MRDEWGRVRCCVNNVNFFCELRYSLLSHEISMRAEMGSFFQLRAQKKLKIQIEQNHDRLEMKIGLNNETITDNRNIGRLFSNCFLSNR